MNIFKNDVHEGVRQWTAYANFVLKKSNRDYELINVGLYNAEMERMI